MRNNLTIGSMGSINLKSSIFVLGNNHDKGSAHGCSAITRLKTILDIKYMEFAVRLDRELLPCISLHIVGTLS